jgi:hypothetical protein
MSVGVIAHRAQAAPAGKVPLREGVGGRFWRARSDFLGFSVRPCAPQLSLCLCTAVHPPCGGSHHGYRTASDGAPPHHRTAPPQ